MASDVIERLRYYQRQYLGAEDFTAEQDYQRSMRRRHNLGPHTWGIVAGLEIVEVPAAGGAADVYVMPGLAIDGFGREIVVLEPAQVLPTLVQRFKNQAGVYGLWLGFRDELGGRPRAGITSCETGDQFGRVRETFELVVEPREPTHDEITIAGQQVVFNPAAVPADPNAEVSERLTVPADESVPHQQLPDDENDPRWLVPLGNLTWDGNRLVEDNAVPPVVHQGRRYVSAVAEGLYTPASTLTVRRRDAPDPLPADAADPFYGGVAATVQGSLTVNRTVRAEQDLHVLGKAGIGTDAPKVKLHVVGGTAATLAEASGYAVLGDTAGPNLVADTDELQARNNGAAAALHLQAKGGDLVVHQDQVNGRVVIKNDNGRVGIGTLDPKVKLQVAGGVDATLAAEDSGYLVLGDTAGFNVVFDDNEIMARNAGGKSGLHFQAEGGDVVVHNNAAAGTQVVVKDAGQVGIGTTLPKVKLHIEGGADVALGDNDGYLVLGSVDGENVVFDNNEIQARNNGVATPLYLNREGGGMFLHHGQAEARQFVVTNNGLVGIGVQVPQTSLHINAGTDVSLAANSGFLILGPTNDHHVAFDANEIQARNANAAATLFLQAEGGRLETHTHLGESGKLVQVEDGSVGIGTSTPLEKLDVRGDVRAFGWVTASDLRLKKNVKPLASALAAITRLQGVEFEWNPDTAEITPRRRGKQLGFIAQEVEKVLPQSVVTDEDGGKNLQPLTLLPILVEAIKELAAENEALAARVRRLEEG